MISWQELAGFVGVAMIAWLFFERRRSIAIRQRRLARLPALIAPGMIVRLTALDKVLDQIVNDIGAYQLTHDCTALTKAQADHPDPLHSAYRAGVDAQAEIDSLIGDLGVNDDVPVGCWGIMRKPRPLTGTG